MAPVLVLRSFGGSMNSKEQKNIERLLVFTYFFHHIFMIIQAIYLGWDNKIPLLMGVAAVSTIFIYIGSYWTYEFRAFFTVLMVEISLIITGLQHENVLGIAVPMVSIAVAMGLYGIPNLLIVPTVTEIIIIFYHYQIISSFKINNFYDVYVYIVPFVNIFVINGYVYFWVIKRRLSANAMRKVIDNLQIAQRSKDDFLANVSHEIRTPINTINGMSEVILKDHNLQTDVREKIEDIQTSGRNLLSIVTDMLDFSELQSGRLEIVDVSYNITSTINDVINIAYAQKKDKDIELIVDCDSNIPMELVGDENKIRRVLMCIVNNAIKFTNEGCVTLVIESRKETYGINLSITVKDTGIGMDKKSMENLFKSFGQVDTKRNRQEGGVGLGLAISQSIVEKMGGFITVKSELGKGSEFQIVIPQKVAEYEPIISLSNPSSYNVLTYIKMEQFEHSKIRDEYSNNLVHIIRQLNVNTHLCHNLAEFKRREQRSNVTHAFITITEYREDKEYFNEISKKISVVVIIDKAYEKEIICSSIIKMFKPFYILSAAMVLSKNNCATNMTSHEFLNKKFIAPDVKILIVDDNAINLKVASAIMEPYKMQIVTALRGAEALDKIESKDFDIIFLDHMMPEMDGVETLKRIRNKNAPYFKNVPVIALTANAVAGAKEMFLREGFQEFVAKPIETSILDRVLRHFIPYNKQITVEEENNNIDNEKYNEEITTSNNIELLEEKVVQDDVKWDDDTIIIGDIDIEQGISYCGTRETYYEILKMHFDDGDDNYKKIQDYFDNKDWKNYTILLHALKSSMKSIGANKLSDMAKELELAGKREDSSYIIEYNESAMVEYKRILGLLGKLFGNENSNDNESSLSELSKEELLSIVNEFEDAVYTFEEEKMYSVIKKMEGHSFNSNSLDDIANTIIKKIRMSDYMSAGETLRNIFEKLLEEVS